MDSKDIDAALGQAHAAHGRLVAAARSLDRTAAEVARLLEARPVTRSPTAFDLRLDAKRWRAISEESARFVEKWGQMAGHARPCVVVDTAPPLTEIEIEIVRRLPSQLRFAEIARQLQTSVEVVRARALAVYRKLGAASRADAVARASRLGILSTGESRDDDHQRRA